MRSGVSLTLLSLVVSCAPPGSPNNNPGVGAPSVVTYAANPAYYAINSAITPNTVTSDKTLSSFSITPALPSGFSFSTTTGTITGTPAAALPAASYTVQASNQYGSIFTHVTLIVVSAAPAISYAGSPLTYYRGIPISALSATNTGDVIQRCSISPALPSGLSLNASNCQITGTPSVLSAATSYTVTATNPIGSSTATISIQVNDLLPSLSFSPSSYTFPQNSAIAAFRPANSGGIISSCNSTPPLPAGLSIAPDCTISGTPTTVTAAASYSIAATNGAGTSSAPVTITIAVQAPAISFTGSPYVFYDATAITPVTPTNSGGAITGCASYPSLPAGLAISASTCQITGTPSAASAATSYLITAANAGGTSQQSINIQVAETAPHIAYSPTNYTFNKSVAITPVSATNTGGTIASCSAFPALPSGLNLSSTCGITGTPTTAMAAANYTITATNSAGSSTATLNITVTDAPPAFSYPSSPYIFTKGAPITTVVASSTGGTITSCSTAPSLPTGLTLNTTNCSISGTPTAVTATATYTITGTNAAGSANAPITITVNDVAPSIAYAGSPYNFNINTAIPTQTPSNTGGTITNCTSTPALPAGLAISTSTCAISGTPTASSALTTYTITASNSGGNSSAAIQIQVTNAAPSISYSPATKTFTNGTAITAWNVTNAGGSIASCTISPALPGGLSLNTSTCAITGTPSAVSAATNYTVTATNNGGSSPTTITIQVTDTIPAISYAGSPYSFGINAAITSQTPTNTGGVIASCSASPALPAGLSISSACVISGTPTVAQAATNYTITATNTAGSATTSISIAVITVPAISYPNSPYVFTKGTAIATVSPTNTGSTITSCAHTGTLPTGLSFSTTTCAITGTPTALSTATNYSVTASNGQGSGTAATVNITVVDVPPTISYSPNTYTFNKNVAITNVTPTLGGGMVTSCTSNPALPTGLSINNTSCVISGTPTAYAPSQSYTITASNTGGSASATLTIQVNDSLPALTYAGSPYSWNINASVGTITPTNTGGTVASCSASPTLPAGLSLSNTCVITGTPTVMQAATNYTVTATNSGGNAAVGISIAVIAAPVLSYPSSPYSFGVNTAISTVVPNNTGSATTSCSISPALPSGLSLNTTTCAITGTPTATSAAANYTVTGTNSAGSSNAIVNIAVVAAPSISYAANPYAFTLRTAITPVSVTNSGGAIASCVASPTLPAGLALSSSCAVSGTPSSISSSSNYTITATNVAGSASATLTIRVKDLPEIVYYSTTNINGLWNQTAESSQNVFRITDDGLSINALTQNTNAGLDSITPAFIGTGGSVIFNSLTATNGAWNGTSPGTFNVWKGASTGGSLAPLASSNNATLNSEHPPVFSPNGAQIAFVSMQNIGAAASSSYNIWIMNADGTSPVALTQNTNASYDSVNPIFSPDGTKIYFQSTMNANTAVGAWNTGAANASNNIWSISTNGATLTRITNETGGTTRDCTNPSVSPDGLNIVYVSRSRVTGTTPSSTNIWYISSGSVNGVPAGTALTQNTATGLNSSAPSFSPDGTKIVFQSKTDLTGSGTGGVWNGTAAGSRNIWVITSWSTTPAFTALTANSAAGLDSITPAFSPDNAKIVFSSLMNVGATASSSYNLFVMNANGSSQTALTQNTNAGLDSYLAPSYVVNTYTVYSAPAAAWYIAP